MDFQILGKQKLEKWCLSLSLSRTSFSTPSSRQVLDPVLRGNLLHQPPAPGESFPDLALPPGKYWILYCERA